MENIPHSIHSPVYAFIVLYILHDTMYFTVFNNICNVSRLIDSFQTILPEHLPNEPFSVSMPLSKITTTCELSSPFRTPLERSTSEPPHSAASTISSSSSTGMFRSLSTANSLPFPPHSVDGAISRRASKLMRSPVGDGGEMEGFGHFFTSLPLGMVKVIAGIWSRWKSLCQISQ